MSKILTREYLTTYAAHVQQTHKSQHINIHILIQIQKYAHTHVYMFTTHAKIFVNIYIGLQLNARKLNANMLKMTVLTC